MISLRNSMPRPVRLDGARWEHAMKHEKSCGALVYRTRGKRRELLLIRLRKGGHWSFPMGHVEEGETERETALREVKEETGISVELQDGFRVSVEYSPKRGVQKQVVYFLGKAVPGPIVRQKEEVRSAAWMPVEVAVRRVTYDNDRMLIAKAQAHFLARQRPNKPIDKPNG